MQDTKSHFSQLIEDKMSNAIRFHMPAHNGANLNLSEYYDITELSFSDNLQSPKTEILALERRIADSYHAPHALIFTSGATSAIATAIAAAKTQGDTLIVDTNAHKSIFAYARLLGLKVMQTPSFDDFAPSLITLGSRIGGVVITSPDYFGRVYSLDKARELANLCGAFLVCDQSHGSHFAFSSLLPTPSDNIADITISSWHKTLPVLTGGAVATCSDMRIYQLMIYYRSLVHTTSPSYLTITSIDKANELMREHGEEYYAAIKLAIDTFAATLNSRYRVIDTSDFSRLVISAQGSNASVIAAELEKRHIYIEMSYEDKLVLIVTPFNYVHLPTLATALAAIDVKSPCVKVGSQPLKLHSVEYASNIDFVQLTSALGRISASEVGIYPPGTPILSYGDTITADILKIIEDNIDKCFGLICGQLVCFGGKNDR